MALDGVGGGQGGQCQSQEFVVHCEGGEWLSRLRCCCFYSCCWTMLLGTAVIYPRRSCDAILTALQRNYSPGAYPAPSARLRQGLVSGTTHRGVDQMPYLGGTVYCANAGWAWRTNKEPPPTRLSSKRRCFTIARVESLASRRTFERCNEVQPPLARRRQERPSILAAGPVTIISSGGFLRRRGMRVGSDMECCVMRRRVG